METWTQRPGGVSERGRERFPGGSVECARAQDWDRAPVLGTEKQDVCPRGQSSSGAAGESQTELAASWVIV